MAPSETPGGKHEGGLSVRDQIERYRTAFIAVVTMVLLAAVTGGYILAHENLKLPSWVPVLGKNYFTLKADFQTAQAVTPGQGQAVTIAGAKIGEIASVDLHDGVAVVTMKVTPKYALIYKNATLLLRPKTQLKDMTVEVDPGTPSTGRLHSGETIPLSQTAPDEDFDQFLALLDAETRAYLQELLAGAGEGFKNNGKALSATLKRLDPIARYVNEISQQLTVRHQYIARSIHNFRLLVEALGNKDKQLTEFVDASNTVFKTFGEEGQNVQKTVQLLPGALEKTKSGLGKFAVAADALGPTFKKLEPTASALGPAQEKTGRFFKATTPIFKSQIRPFARQILPVINEIQPSTQQLGEAFPKLASSFSVLNELFNELGYNPGAKQAGFLFFASWGAHDLNSTVSSADAHGVLGRSLLYFNCEVAPLLKAAGEVNPTVNLLVGLLNPPSRATCQSAGVPTSAAASERGRLRLPAGNGGSGVFSGLGDRVFGQSLRIGLANGRPHAASGAVGAPARTKQSSVRGGGR
jgi:phospholipid/cholesterol/gamma-HCH transport system substrate-binding protein